MKTKELIGLYPWDGLIIADIFDKESGRKYTTRFLFYSKTEVIRKLRREGVKCPGAVIAQFHY